MPKFKVGVQWTANADDIMQELADECESDVHYAATKVAELENPETRQEVWDTEITVTCVATCEADNRKEANAIAAALAESLGKIRPTSWSSCKSKSKPLPTQYANPAECPPEVAMAASGATPLWPENELGHTPETG